MAVDAVIFDIGNVLIEWNPVRFYDRWIGETRRRALFQAVDLEAMNLAIDAGADFRGTVEERARAHPDWGAEIRAWHDRWIEMASPEIPRSVALLRALRSKGVPVFCLTNFGVGSFDYARTQYPFFDEFDRRFVSGHMRVTKPDPAIYAAVEAEGGVAPERLLFADDSAANVAAARQRGWQAHLFDGPEGWAERLVEEGLLSAAEAA